MIPELMVPRVVAPPLPAPPLPDAKAASLGGALGAAFGDLVEELAIKAEPPAVDASPRHALPDWPVDLTGAVAVPLVPVPASAVPFVGAGDGSFAVAEAGDMPDATGKPPAPHPAHGLLTASLLPDEASDQLPTVLPDAARSFSATGVPASDLAGEREALPPGAVAQEDVNPRSVEASDPPLQGQPDGPAKAKPQAQDSRERLTVALSDAVVGETTDSEAPSGALAAPLRPVEAGARLRLAIALGGTPAIGPIPSAKDVPRQPDAAPPLPVQADRAAPPRPVPDRDARNRIQPDRAVPDPSPAVSGKAGTLPKAAPSDDPTAPASPAPAPVAAVLQAPARVATGPQPVKGAMQADGAGESALPNAAVAPSGPQTDTPTGTKDAVVPVPDRTAGPMPDSPAFATSDPTVPLRHDARPAEARHPAQPMPPTVAPMLVDAARALPDAPVTLTLAPEDLGALRFEMQSRGDTIHVSLTVERPETLDMLRRHVEQLTGEFRQAGFANASFSFAGGWGGGQERASGTGYASRSVEDEEHPVARVSKHVNGGLDLRL